MQPPDTYSDMSFVSCSYTFLRIYSQRALSLFRRDWTHCRGLVCTGHVAGESTHLWRGKGTNGFNGYFLQCKSYHNDDNITLLVFLLATKYLYWILLHWDRNVNSYTWSDMIWIQSCVVSELYGYSLVSFK